MEYFKALIVLTLCSLGHANEELSAAMQRRKNVHPMYARQYGQYGQYGQHGQYARHAQHGPYPDEYEYAYAAIPLHAPVPIVQLLSPSPKYGPAHKRARQPERDLHAYASAHSDDYEPYDYYPGHKYSSEEEETQPVVIYARPNKHGGYSYRKRPFDATPRPKREPIVFRIHKYKITKE